MRVSIILVFLWALLTVEPSLALSPSELFKKVSPSVVVVRSLENESSRVSPVGSLGSGVVIDNESVVTNFHVVSKAPYIKVVLNKKYYPAKLVYADLSRDLAQLSVPGLPAPVIKRGTYKKLNTGDTVFAIGAPQGLDLTLSQGLVSSIRKKNNSVLIQTSSAISQGSSGGGLFDENGQLVGITTMMMKEGQNLNFAVPVDWIAELPKRTLVSSPEVADLLLEAGFYNAKKNIPKVLEITSKWLAIEPDSAYAQILNGDACLKLRLFDTAISVYEKAAQTTADGTLALAIGAKMAMGEAYIQLHRYHSAISPLKSYIEAMEKLTGSEMNPSQILFVAASYEKLAKCYEVLRQYDEAVKCQQRVAELIPSSPSPAMCIGRIMRLRGNEKMAIAKFKEALKKAPGNPHVLYEMGMTYLKSKDYRTAALQFQLAKTNPLLLPLALEGLGKCQLALKDYGSALLTYKEAVEADPDDHRFYGQFGQLLLRKKEYAKAISALEKYSKVNPTDHKTWSSLGKALMKLKQYDKAELAFSRTTHLKGATVNDWYYLGLLQARGKRYVEAGKSLETAFTLKPSSATIQFRLGKVYVAAGNRKKAVQQIKALKDLDRAKAVKLKKLAVKRGLLKR